MIVLVMIMMLMLIIIISLMLLYIEPNMMIMIKCDYWSFTILGDIPKAHFALFMKFH